ncbi:P-loop containing nucleoside triphosphate hydrolase protein [Daedaleopsis nitida]|nr:P-loop containing nucleoside triphosphate hydrolase protein [Daedaleopsis nitida]
MSRKSEPSTVFADAQSAEFLAAAADASQLPNLHGRPEIIVTGRANVGKSSLLNAVLGRRNLLHTSKKPGRTQTLNFYRVGPAPGHLVLVDAPGYGARGRPEWGALFEHYLQTRRELRRVFLLINAAHGLNPADALMLRALDAQLQAAAGKGSGWTLQAVVTKADTWGRLAADVFAHAPTCLPPLVTSVRAHPHFGVDAVRASIVEACALGHAEARVCRTADRR